jgi:hypothetical protein
MTDLKARLEGMFHRLDEVNREATMILATGGLDTGVQNALTVIEQNTATAARKAHAWALRLEKADATAAAQRATDRVAEIQAQIDALGAP